MKEFTRLVHGIEEASNAPDRIRSVQKYFASIHPEDAHWALDILMGNRPKRLISSSALFALLTADLSFPDWLIEISHDHVGDRSETLALLIGKLESAPIGLHSFLEEYYQPLFSEDGEAQAIRIKSADELLGREELLVWFKLITGTLKPKVTRSEIALALSKLSGIAPVSLEERMIDQWKATSEGWLQLIDTANDTSRSVYAFHALTPLESDPIKLGGVDDWHFEWKWSGIQAQLIVDEGKVLLLTANHEVITDRFPELTNAARLLSTDAVIVGDIVAWSPFGALPLSVLERRLTRRVTPKILAEVPIVFIAHDLLKIGADHLSQVNLALRREQLEALLGMLQAPTPIVISPRIDSSSWKTLTDLHSTLLKDVREGIVLKHRESQYPPASNHWYEWRKPPGRITVVLMYAERGESKGAFGLYSFGVWNNEELVPVAKVPLQLDDQRELDDWITENALDRFGPVRTVPLEEVFELEFYSIEESSKRKAGVVLGGAIVTKWVRKKSPSEATTVEELYEFLPDRQ